LQQAEYSGRVADAPPMQWPARAGREPSEEERVREAETPAARSQARIQPERIARETQVREARGRRRIHENTEHGGMQVQMQMAVDVVQLQARGVKPGKLGGDFRGQLRSQRGPQEVTKSDADRVVGK